MPSLTLAQVTSSPHTVVIVNFCVSLFSGLRIKFHSFGSTINAESDWVCLYFGNTVYFWCRIHLWFHLMGGSSSKVDDVTALPCHVQDGGYVLLCYRYDNNKMAAICYYGNVMTTTRWRLYVTMVTVWQQDGGYMLLWKRYDNNKMAAICYYGNVMITTRWRLYVTMETLW